MRFHVSVRSAAALAFLALAVAAVAAPPVRILPVGDSITYGASVAGGYRLPLWGLLTNAGYTVDFTGTQTGNGATDLPDSDHEGRSGWLISGGGIGIYEIIAGVFAATADPDVLLLLIGTNDFGSNNDVNNATNRLDALIGRIVTNRPYCKVIVANLTVRGEPYNTNIQTNYNNSIPGIVSNHAARGEQVYFTDLYNAVPLSDFPDQLHPGAAGYAKMATNWFRAITNVISPLGTTNAPGLVRAVAPLGLSNVVVTFSKPVADSATNAAHYALSGGLSVLGATLDTATLRQVTLQTSPQVVLSNYTITVGGVTDRTAAAVAIAPGSTVSFRAPAGTPGSGPVATSGVFANVPEAAGYQLVYSVELPSAASWPAAAVYDIDLHAYASNFTRVAYYLELQTNGGPYDFAWVSLDPVTNNVNAIGIPTVSSGATFQQPVTNMNVLCTITNVANGTNFSGGNIEFWPSNYGPSNAVQVTNASDAAYDWGDARSAGTYGSMQLHNHDAGQTILAFSRWGGIGGINDLGLGNRPGSADVDWTFAQNASSYVTRRLQVLVLPTTNLPPVPVNALGLEGWSNAVLNFSRPLADDATNVADYALSGGLAVLNVALDPATKVRVTLTTTPQLPNTIYTATVNNVRERSTNQAVIATNSTIAFRSVSGRGAARNVPEAGNYALVYSLNLPTAASYGATVPYDVDLHAFASNFTRVAYYLELQTNGGTPAFAWVSMDAITNNVNAIGVPSTGSGAGFQQNVTNMNVASSVDGIVTGTGLTGGNIEFWPNNYSASNAVSVPNASNTAYDWGDLRSGTGNYGSMQIHNHDASQVLFAFNRWGGAGGNADLGVGNRPGSADVDWTLAQNAASYTSRLLQVYALLAAATNPPVITGAASYSAAGLTNVVITFSAPLQDDATNVSYYVLSGGLSVLSAVLDPITKVTVNLTTTPQLPNAVYTATVNSVSDRTTNHLVIATNSTVAFSYTIATLTWDADTASAGAQDGAGTWSDTTTNWWDGTANTNWSSVHPDNAVIGSTSGAAGTITVSGAPAFGALTFNPPGSGSYMLSGGTLTLSNNPTLTANADVTIGSALAGAGNSLTKAGTGTVTLTGAGSYTGLTTLTAGLLQLGSNTAGGTLTGPVAINSGSTLSLFHPGTGNAFNNNVAGNGTWLLRGSGASANGGYDTIGGNNSGFGGTLVVTNARMQVDSTNDLGGATVVVQDFGQILVNAALTITNAISLRGIGWTEGAGNLGAIRFSAGTWAGPITLTGSARLGQYGSTVATLAGDIGGPYQLELWNGSGSAQWNLNPATSNTFGPLLLTGSENVYAMSPYALGTGTVTISSGAQLWLSATQSYTLANSLAGAGNLIVNTPGGLTVTNTAGSINIGNGIFYMGWGTNAVLTVNGGSITAGNLRVAGSAANNAALTLNSGTMSFNGTANSDLAGASGSSCSLNIAGGTLSFGGYVALGGPGPLTWNQTGGSVTFPQQVNVGNGGASPVTLTVSAGTITQLGNTFYVGVGTGQATLTVTNSASVNLSNLYAGYAAGNYGQVNLSSGATLKMSGISVFGNGASAGGIGRLNMSGGTFTNAGIAYLGNGAGSTGVVAMTGGSFYAGGGLYLGGNSGISFGAMYQTGGAVTVSGEMDAGWQTTGAYGFYQMTGGSLSNNNWMQAGRGSALGLLYLRGGTVSAGGAAQGLICNGSTGVIYAAGGSVINVQGKLTVGYSANTRAEITIADNAEMRVAGATGVQFNNAGPTVGYLNLNGGLLQAASLFKSSSGSAVMNFNGGTLRANTSTAAFLQGLDNVFVFSGGAVIDTDSNSVAVAQSFLAPPGSGITGIVLASNLTGYIGAPYVSITGGGGTGATAIAQFDYASGSVTGVLVTCAGVSYTSAPAVTLVKGGKIDDAVSATASIGANAGGGLSKLGAGTLALNGIYSAGQVTVSGGTLGGTGTINATVNLPAGCALQPGYLTTAGALSASSVTFAAGAQFNPLINGGTSLLRVTATNGLTVPSGGGAVTVNVFNVSLPVGTYTVLDYAGAIQGGEATNLVLGIVPPRMSAYLTNNTANTSIDLVVVTAGEPIKWRGGVNANWDINVSTNWLTTLGAVTTAYQQVGPVGDGVLFDDTALGNFAIALQANVSPSSLVASNEVSDYSIAGGFGIGGALGLRKYGAARLTLAASNTYGGGTLIAGGTLQLGNGGAIGIPGDGPITNNAALVFNHGDTGAIGNVISGTGSVAKAGAGTLTLTSANTYSGGTTVNGGTLAGTLVSSIGTGALTINAGAKVSWQAGLYAQPNFGNLNIIGGVFSADAASQNQVNYTGAKGVLMQGGMITSINGLAGPANDGGNGNFMLNNVTLTVSGTSQSVINSTTFAVANTATFDVGVTGAGVDLLVQSVINQPGTLVKKGAGVMRLTGNNIYTGPTLINAGTLAFGATGSISNTPFITVSAGAVFDVSAAGQVVLSANQALIGGGLVQGSVVASAGSRLMPGAASVGGPMETLSIVGNVGLSATSTNVFNLGGVTNAGGGFNDLVAITGDLSPSNSVIRIEPNAPLAAGTYRLFTYTGGKTGTFNPAPVFPLSLARGLGASLDESIVGQVNLVVTGAAVSLVWLPQTNALWNGADANWSNTTAAALSRFTNADAVVFSDAGAYSNVVTIPAAITPSWVRVSSASNYTFSGAGGIAGAGGLIKDGSGTLVLLTTNTYAAGTVISNGLLQIGNSAMNGIFGSGPYAIAGGGTLRLNYATVAVPVWTNIGGAGTFALTVMGTSKDWGQAALTNSFTGTLRIETGRVSTAAGAGLGLATTVVVTAGGQLGTWNGGSFPQNLVIAGTGYGEAGYEAAVRMANAGLLTTFSGNMALAGSATIGAGGTGLVSGVISGPAGAALTIGTANLANNIMLTATNTYAGDTVLRSGNLSVGNVQNRGVPSNLGAGTNLVFNGGTLRYLGPLDAATDRIITNAGAAGYDVAGGSRLTLTGPISGGGQITKVGAGTLTWATNLVNATGGWRIQRGTLILSGTTYSNTSANEEWLGNTAGDYSWLFLTNNSRVVKTGSSWFQVATIVGSTGVVVMTGGSFSSTDGGKGFLLGNQANTLGVFHQLGGSVYVGYEVDVGYGTASSYGFYNLVGGSLSNGNWQQAARVGMGLMYLNGGTNNQNSAGQGLLVGNTGTGVLYVVGSQVSAAGRLSLGWQGSSRGEVTIAGASRVTIGNSGVQFNQSGTTFDVLNLNGGLLAASNLYKQVIGGYSVVNFNGGTLRALGSQVLLGPGAWAAGALDAAYVHAGGAIIDSSNLTVTISQNLLAPTGNGVTALPWSGPITGYLGAPYVSIRGGGGTGATAVALFDVASGSVTGLLVTSPGVDYSSPPSVALIGGGPTNLDLGVATVAAAASGGLTKFGTGTLVLAGVNTYSGLTTVSAGTLILDGVQSGSVSVNSGAWLSGTGVVNAALGIDAGGALQPGDPAAAGSLTVSAATFAAGAQFQPLINGTASVLRVTGVNGLTVPAGANVATVNVQNASLAVGAYTVIDYAGAIQGGAATNLVLGQIPPRAVMYLTNNAANTSIDLVVVAAGGAIKWLGLVDGSWNINTTTNWVSWDGAVTTAYQQVGLAGDSVVFDDTALGNFNITLQTNVSPASLVATNEANDYTIAGGFGIGGSVALRKYGAARFALATSNSYSGGTLIAGGTLQVGTGGVSAVLGSGFISNNASLVFNHGDTAALGTVIAGTGSVTKAGSGQLTLQANNTYAGATIVSGGTLVLNTPNFYTYLNGNIFINGTSTLMVTQTGGATRYDLTGRTITFDASGGGTLTSGASVNWTWGGNTYVTSGGARDNITGLSGFNWGIGGGCTFNVVRGTDPSADLVMSVSAGNTAAGLTKNGNGILLLTTNNAFTGGAALNAGVLAVGHNVALGPGTLTMAGGTLMAAGGARALSNLVTVSAASFVDTSGGDLTLNGAVSGSAALIKQGTGTLTLVSTNAYSGNTIVSNGTLLVNGTIGAGVMTIDAGATLGGTGLVKGVVSQNGILSPGTGIGILTVSNQVNCGATAVTRFELGGTNSYDQLVVSDLHTLNGTLEVVTTNGYVPASGDRFNLITNTALGGLLFGPFPSTSLPALPSGMGWEVQYSASDAVNLVVTGSVVSLTAYEQWAAQIPNPADRGDQNDADNDGYANLLEYSQGSDPTNNANNAKLNLVRTNGMEVIVFNRVNTATDIVYEVQASYAPTNNAEWQGLATNSVGSWGSSTNVNDDNTATIHRVWVSDLILGTNRSLRLKVTRP